MNNIDFYNTYTEHFLQRTQDIDMTNLYTPFLKHLIEGNSILDLGCGSGRDSLYFHKNGFKVTSLDASISMINHCRATLSNEIIHTTFEEFDTTEKFDAIWACASLLHVPKENMKATIDKYIKFLNINGIFFMSFKDAPEDFIKSGRTFTCFTMESLKSLIDIVENIEVLDYLSTDSNKKNTPDEKWVSVIIRRIR